MNTPAYEQKDFNPGGIADRPDARDYQWDEVGAAAPAFDWEKGYDVDAELVKVLNLAGFRLLPKDQNGSGSCGGQAWSMYDAVQEAFASGTFEERSAFYVYNQTFVPFPGGGSMGRDNAQVVKEQGVCREAILSSYDNGIPPSEAFMQRAGRITEAARTDAKKARSLAYVNVAPTIDLVAQAIATCGGVVLGLNGSNNGTWTSMFPKPPASREWGHWIYAGKAKLINGKRYIGLLNSWGPNVGEQGWQWIGEDYFTSGHVFSVWAHTYNNNPPPAGFTHHFAQHLHLGDESDEVNALQKALQTDGSFPATVKPTRYYGNITRQAVLAFQRKHNVAPASELDALAGRTVGPKTIAKLNELFDK